jgi:acylphosphatase
MLRRAEILVNGLVQGVFYRYTTKREADTLRLTGSVRNLSDGRVEVICEGTEDDIKRLIAWCERGPQGAVVKGVTVSWKEHTGAFNDFRICN